MAEEGQNAPAARGTVRVALRTALLVLLVLLALAGVGLGVLLGSGYYLARTQAGLSAPVVEDLAALAAENAQLAKIGRAHV